jgi:hypothetical protein
MHTRVRWAGILTVAATAVASRASAQGAAKALASPPGPESGAVAPDFSLPGATRYGLLKAPVRLADYRGRTVVLAFFYEARTKG